MIWTETNIARALAFQFFSRRHLCVVPNCGWTGHECDLLVVTNDLRIIDVEIKISRADLKADAKKEKWWRRAYNWPYESPYGRLHGAPAPDMPLLHPIKVWKHYYAMPMQIWKDDLLGALPSTASGVVLLNADRHLTHAHVKRRALPNKGADRLTPAQAIDIARLASLRMWETMKRMEELRGAA